MQPKENENVYVSTMHSITEVPFQIRENHSKVSSAAGLLSDRQFEIISLVLSFLMQLSHIAAIIGNSLNIAVFIKLGFSESSNISLTALAVADLICVVSSVWSTSCFLLNFRQSILPFNATNVSLLTGSGLWSFVSRTVAWITAFISLERCLCILVPLKVKRIITPTSTLVAMVCICALTFCPFLLSFFTYDFVWVYYLHLNATILDVVPSSDKYSVLLEKIVFVVYGVIQPLLAFSIVLVCTVFLVVQLRKMSFWRKSVTSAKNRWGHNSGGNPATSAPAVQDRISQKEERLVRMVVVIATTFIACFTPTCVLLLCSTVFDEFFFFGAYRRLFVVCGMITILGQSVSGSVNIVIYYIMTSKFRSGLRCILGLDRQEEKKNYEKSSDKKL